MNLCGLMKIQGLWQNGQSIQMATIRTVQTVVLNQKKISLYCPNCGKKMINFRNWRKE